MRFQLKNLKKKIENMINTLYKVILYRLYLYNIDNNENNIFTLLKNDKLKKINSDNLYINNYHSSKNNCKFKSNFILVLFIMFLSLINSILSIGNYIILTINQTGYNRIFYNGHVDSFYPIVSIRPQSMYINNNQKDLSDIYNFEVRNNAIKLIFDSPLSNISCLFYQCSNITKIYLSNFDTSSVTNMAHLFHGCTSLTSVDLTGIITTSTEHFDSMFQDCSSLIKLDLSMLNTSNAVYIHLMFHQCSSLSSLDLSNFQTDKAKTMIYMFSGCTNLKHLDISNFDTSSVTDMEAMFNECSSLLSLNLAHFDTTKVTNMKLMFNKLQLSSLDLSNFNTDQVNNMAEMFSECDKLTFLNLKNFNFSIVEQISDFLSGCSQLRNINLLDSIIGENNLISSMIDNSLENPTICTNEIILIKIISRYECPLIDCSNWREEEIQMKNIKNKFMGNCILSHDEEESCYE